MAKTYKKISGVWTPIKKIYKKISGTWTEVKKMYKKISGTWTIVHSGRVLVTNNIDAYVASDAGEEVEHDIKGDLLRNANNILQASDGTRLGRSLDVWFTTDDYANTATQFIYSCYADSDGNRCYDNKDWLYGTYSTGTQNSTNCNICNCFGSNCACHRTIHYNNYAWR